MPSSSQTTENELPAARTLLQAVTITPMMTESKKLTRLRSTRTARARQYLRMGKLLSQFFRSGQIQLSRKSHEDRAVGNAHVWNEVCLF